MGEIVLISTLKIKISIPHGLVYHQSQRPQINHRNTYVGVPVNTEITNEEYWEQVSELYDTKGKVAYFIDTELPQNAALNCLQAVENYLYSFVLWRWYTIAGQIDEAQVWNASFTASADDIKSSLLVRTTPIRRPMHPW